MTAKKSKATASKSPIPKAKSSGVKIAAHTDGSPKRRAERGERLTVYLPAELAKTLRVHCAVNDRSVSDAVTEAVATFLRES